MKNTLKDITILHVDDSKTAQMEVLLLLEDHVGKLYSAKNGQEGLESFKKYKPDIIISDVDMPVMDGLEMCKKIKKINPLQPITLLTGLDNLKTLKKAIEIQINSFIAKPLNEDNFFNTIYSLAQTVHNRRNTLHLKKLQDKQEKVETAINLLKEINHHWRQPLSIISSLASKNLVRKEFNQDISKEELLEDMEIIAKKIENLANTMNKIDTLELKDTNMDEIDTFIQISNPIYKN